MKEYYKYKIPTQLFYNNDIKEKVYQFYKKDFEFCKKHGIDYKWSIM